MESLRWVLLAAGIVFVLVIYFLGRNRRQRNNSFDNELDDDLPEFTARNLDDFDEGVGEVRVITGAEDVYQEVDSTPSSSFAEDFADERLEPEFGAETFNDEKVDDSETDKNAVPDIVVLYILPKPDQVLLGAQVNSSAQAMGLVFGDMNIFHYQDNGRNVFSLANMLEPGSFNPDTMHDLKTTGLTIFMQFSGQNPLDDLTEMLQRSYQLSGLLDARLCNHKREPLTEQDAETYRARANQFVESKVARPTSNA